MATKFVAPKMLDRELYLCVECAEMGLKNDSVKSTPTPHCLECGKHHGLITNCDGSPTAAINFTHIKMFYTHSRSGVNEIADV